jgi:lipopolysaccharide biosynthesis glycosyltransferase
MSRNLIYQVFIGKPNAGYETCLKSVRDYTDKYGIDYFIQTVPRTAIGAYFEKMFLVEKLGQYDRVAYIDADILVTPHAQNIFEKYPNPNVFYAYDENDVSEHMDRDPYVKELTPVIPWPKNSRGKFVYFNTGVMIFSKPLLNEFNKMFSFDTIPKGPRVNYFAEQTYYNYWLQNSVIPFVSLDHSFNRMDLGLYDPRNVRYEANFIHYAGPCKYGADKYVTMVEDYKNLYGKNS